MPSVADFGLVGRQQDPRGVLPFVGGESAALARVQDYFWTKVGWQLEWQVGWQVVTGGVVRLGSRIA